MKTALRVTFALIKGKLSLTDLPKMVFHMDSIYFGTFFSLVSSLYKSMNCFLRTVRKVEDGKNALIAGLFSGLAAIADQNASRRITMTYMVFARSVQVLSSMLDDKKIVKERNGYYLTSYILSTMLIVYLMYFEKEA